MRKAYSQSGFTLIEMVAVIIILAIMAATALPRFINLSQDARLSALQGLAGGLRSAAALAKSQWLASNSGTADAISMGATTVAVYTATTAPISAMMGYPRGDVSSGIVAALDTTTGFDSGVDATLLNWIFWPTGVATSASCYALYQSGTVTVTASAVGCS
jgi:MSHA pilin protein MshA